MPGLEVVFELRNMEGVLAHLDRLGMRFKDAMRAGLLSAGYAVSDRIKERITYRGGPSPEFLHMRQGDLLRSLRVAGPKMDSQRGQVSVGFVKGPAAPYAKIHEFGGVVKAKKKLLAIPLRFARRGDRMGGAARSMTPLDYEGFWRAAKGGKRLPIFWGTSLAGAKKGKLVPLFLGLPRVTIPARAPIRTAMKERREAVKQYIAEAVRKELEAAGGN